MIIMNKQVTPYAIIYPIFSVCQSLFATKITAMTIVAIKETIETKYSQKANFLFLFSLARRCAARAIPRAGALSAAYHSDHKPYGNQRQERIVKTAHRAASKQHDQRIHTKSAEPCNGALQQTHASRPQSGAQLPLDGSDGRDAGRIE